MSTRLKNTTEPVQGSGLFISVTLCSFVCSVEQVLASGVHASLSVLSGKAPKLINFLCQMGQRKDIPVLGQDGVVRETGIVPGPV